jgi:hypothetical protein
MGQHAVAALQQVFDQAQTNEAAAAGHSQHGRLWRQTR